MQTDSWFQHKRADGLRVPLTIRQLKFMADDALIRNVRVNMRRDIPRFYDRPDIFEPVQTPLAIVAGGPSINTTMDRLREFSDVMVIASAHDHVSRAGIKLKYAVIADGMPTSADYLRHPQKNCTYFLASQIDPACYDAVEGCPVEMWHYTFQVPHELFKGQTTVLHGASTTVIGIMMALKMGYQDLHFFGFDCSYGKKSTHAYDLPDAFEKETISAWIGEEEREFVTDMSLCTQAQAFLTMACGEDGRFFKSTIHGDGLLAETIRSGNSELKARVAVAD